MYLPLERRWRWWAEKFWSVKDYFRKKKKRILLEIIIYTVLPNLKSILHFCFKNLSELNLLQAFLFYGLTAFPELWVACDHDDLNRFREALLNKSFYTKFHVFYSFFTYQFNEVVKCTLLWNSVFKKAKIKTLSMNYKLTMVRKIYGDFYCWTKIIYSRCTSPHSNLFVSSVKCCIPYGKPLGKNYHLYQFS